MSGKILIIDPVATNRIVLKVKLSAAFYQVIQAGTGAEALALAAAQAPDLVLSASELPDIAFPDLVRRLQGPDGPQAPPIIALLAQDDAEARLALLRAGASDVVEKPFSEQLLLARLRSLLRQRHNDTDLGLRADTAEALGFAEAPAPFARAGRVAVVADSRTDASRLCHLLSPFARHDFDAYGYDGDCDIAGMDREPDVVVLRIGKTNGDAGPAFLAELRAAPMTRQARFVVLLDKADDPLAASVLDMGAHEIAGIGADPREIALRIAVQLRRKQTEDQLRARLKTGLQAAVTDPLTGLYNRRYAQSHLKRLIDASAESGSAFAVMVADLDHFKAVNDSHGHAAGDLVLARVSDQLRMSVGAEGMVARIGGEEFLIVIPDTSRGAARQTARRLCRIIRETPISLPDRVNPVHVTISIGVTLAEPGRTPGAISVETLINQADRALYGSKAGGRDTVTLSNRSAA